VPEARHRIGRSARAGWRALFACAVLPAALLAQGRLAPPPTTGPLVGIDDDGFRVRSDDGQHQLRIRAYFHLDGRTYLDSTGGFSTIGLRRARLLVNWNFSKYIAFQFMPDFEPDQKATIQDAFMDVLMGPHWWARIGKMTPPGNLERWTLTSDQPFAERSLLAGLSPDRDMGATLTGEYLGGKVEGTLGVFNGGADGAVNELETNDAKDLLWRVVLRPDVSGNPKYPQGSGVGFFGSNGMEHGVSGNSQLPTLKTVTALTWFQFKESAGAVAEGRRTREGAYAFAHYGPFGTNVEWERNVAGVKLGATRGDVTSEGARAMVSWVLTGENSVQGGIAPAKTFDPDHGSWGAWEVVARASQVHVDDAAFPAFADPTVAAHRATQWSVGVDWYLSRVMKFQQSYEDTRFVGGAPKGDRPPEQALYSRIQLFF